MALSLCVCACMCAHACVCTHLSAFASIYVFKNNFLPFWKEDQPGSHLLLSPTKPLDLLYTPVPPSPYRRLKTLNEGPIWNQFFSILPMLTLLFLLTAEVIRVLWGSQREERGSEGDGEELAPVIVRPEAHSSSLKNVDRGSTLVLSGPSAVTQGPPPDGSLSACRI